MVQGRFLYQSNGQRTTVKAISSIVKEQKHALPL